MGLPGREGILGRRKVELPVRHREETGGARWKRGNAMWQNVDYYKWVNLNYKGQ